MQLNTGFEQGFEQNHHVSQRIWVKLIKKKRFVKVKGTE